MNPLCQRWASLSDRAFLGEALSPQEHDFLSSHPSACPACQGEADVWNTFSAWVDERPAPVEEFSRSIASPIPANDGSRGREQSSPRVRSDLGPSQRRAWAGWALAGAMAAAAAIALWPDPQPASPSRPPAVAKRDSESWAPRIRAVFVEGDVRIGGEFLAHDRPLASDAEIDARHGRACFRVELTEASTARVCLHRGKMKLEQPRPRHLSVRLGQGNVAVSLDPLPQGATLSVDSALGSVTAVGTIFTVEAPVSSSGVAAVLEGKVRVRDVLGKETMLGALESLTLTETGASSPVGRTRDAFDDTQKLLRVGGIWTGGPEATLHLTGTPPDASVRVDGVEVGRAPLWLRLPPGSHVLAVPGIAPQSIPFHSDELVTRDFGTHFPPTETSAPPAGLGSGSASPPLARTPSEWMSDARGLRASGRFREAAEAYQKLLVNHPKSPEVGAALLSLGEIQLANLGDASAALGSFDAYLSRGGGALSQEAMLGRIRALRRLGRRSEELTATEAFLTAFPSSPHAEALHARVEELTSGGVESK